MIDSLYIAATGMQAQQLNVDTIANNLANANTAGFKKGRVVFTDLMVQQAALAQGATGASADAGALAAMPRLGSGVGVASITKLFDLGDLKQTGSAFDVAIQGDGFLEVVMPDGSRAFTRGGSLKVNADGLLVTQSGQTLKPSLTLPANSTNVIVTADGRVRVTEPNRTNPVELGQLELVRFANPSGLLAEGENLYRSTDASGEPIAGRAGADGIGTLAQGFLEGSNVKMVDEMVNLIVAQRAYEASTKVMQASDEMLGMINNLRR
jgi:flagellar basal-body rod protein FlgG